MKTTASSLLPLWNRATEWAHRLAMVSEATSFLYLSTYYVEPDRYGVELLSALLAAAQRGVAVNLLIDSFGQRLGGVLLSAQARASLGLRLEQLRRAGAVVEHSRPRWAVQRFLGGGQHVKIQLSDRGEAIFGSSNISHASFEAWNEYSVALRGPVVPRLLQTYRELGGQVGAGHVEHLVATVSDEANLELDFWLCDPNLLQGPLGPLGWRGTNPVTERLLEMLDSARTSIELTSFYFKPIEALLQALVRAALRGVAVEIHHSHRDALPATDLPWLASATSYERLLDAGVQVYENRHGEHSKIVLVDRAWVAFGSYNFEDAAHDRLAEAMLASRDPRAVEPPSRIFEALHAQADNLRVTRLGLDNLPPNLKRRRAFYGRFKWWL